ncbi:hypothetical protein [uncultured Rikenella sp.]|nr:hypothetical protein [uncultured Rikenella sp.]
MKKLRLKSWVKNLLIMVLFYSTIILGVLSISWRANQIDNINNIQEVR